jgi:hypothetical protein
LQRLRVNAQKLRRFAAIYQRFELVIHTVSLISLPTCPKAGESLRTFGRLPLADGERQLPPQPGSRTICPAIGIDKSNFFSVK